MTMLIELKIQNGEDREKMVLALANSGYSVKVVARKDNSLIIGNDYFVQFEMPDEESK